MRGGTDKAAVRGEMRVRRRAMDEAEKASADARVCAELLARVGATDGIVAVYLASSAEIDLTGFIREMLRRGRALAAPRWNGAAYDLAVLKGLDAAGLRAGPMNVSEPKDADLVAPADVRAWIVPGLAFTADGRRLGYGGGWYDRLMADAAADALKLGVAYGFQIVPDLPAEPHDVPLTAVVCGKLSS